VRAAAVAARHERRAGILDLQQCVERVLAPRDSRRVCFRADQHEVVVHHWIPLHPVPFAQESFFLGPRVHEHDVRIAAPRDVQCLARAEGDDAYLYAGLLLEDRQDLPEQSGLLGGGRRRDGDEPLRQRARCEREP
jgi:hypothetical protein